MKEKLITILDEHGVKHQDYPSYIKIKCIFHDEKTPSLFIYPGTTSYYCFGCGVSGDICKLISKITGREVKDLKADMGVSISAAHDDYTKQINSHLSKEIYDIFSEIGPKPELLDFMVLLDNALKRESLSLRETRKFVSGMKETLISIKGGRK